ncbi:hypothetical protein TWF694_011401 [Orbilia ellipsospora]|uniref:Uncharacterized protein n=1 Tax=Orbilia ellipsospora TaxID=2528407 RepID=A0AAV9X554_9PEZI
MRLQIFSISFFLSAVLAGANIQLFFLPQCTDAVLDTVQSNQANRFDSSGCVATGDQFQSVGVINIDPAFQCNLYADTACQSFLMAVDGSTPQTCFSVIGQSVACFNQQLFNNPYAESLAIVTVGQDRLNLAFDGNFLVSNGIAQACGNTGCDPTKFFEDLDGGCPVVRMEGSYGSVNERDYLGSILGSALTSAITNRQGRFFDLPHFAKVDIVDTAKQSTIATMTIRFRNNCQGVFGRRDIPSGETCDAFLALIPSINLQALPEVNGVVARSFSVQCDPNN